MIRWLRGLWASFQCRRHGHPADVEKGSKLYMPLWGDSKDKNSWATIRLPDRCRRCGAAIGEPQVLDK